MDKKDYEIRVHVEDITRYIDKKCELWEMCGGKVWNVWAFMPAFGQVYCSAQRLTVRLHLGVVTQSHLAYPEGVADLPDDELERWAEKLDELCREIFPEGGPWEAFDREDAMLHSFDFTLNYKGERWADYDDLEEAVAALDETYAKGGSRSDTHAERQDIHRAVEKILEQVMDYYNGHCLSDAVRQYLSLGGV